MMNVFMTGRTTKLREVIEGLRRRSDRLMAVVTSNREVTACKRKAGLLVLIDREA